MHVVSMKIQQRLIIKVTDKSQSAAVEPITQPPRFEYLSKLPILLL